MLYLAKVWCTPKNRQHRLVATLLKSDSLQNAYALSASLWKQKADIVVTRTEIVPATLELIEKWQDGKFNHLYRGGISDGAEHGMVSDNLVHPCA